jgi:hypothetical protein
LHPGGAARHRIFKAMIEPFVEKLKAFIEERLEVLCPW